GEEGGIRWGCGRDGGGEGHAAIENSKSSCTSRGRSTKRRPARKCQYPIATFFKVWTGAISMYVGISMIPLRWRGDTQSYSLFTEARPSFTACRLPTRGLLLCLLFALSVIEQPA